jgi:dipeptidase D
MEAPMNSPAATPSTAMATDHPAVRALEPKALWGYFCDLNRVPRASKREAQVTEFAANFGRQRGLETLVDSVGNVIIRKAATPDRQGRPGVILQAHLDMVHQKNQDTEFDFASEGIRMEVRPDWVWAQGTTLGADNGIGVAAAMAIAALRATVEETADHGGRTVDLVRGRLLTTGREAALSPGDLPEDPARLLLDV